ncbi:hypothetical protein P7K49_012973 [Saguinus oedipus]|uniref:Uncharacterized protein n=1 Tax=Saguinus oedipus TaxID=9490 RepID=A0ABQ9VEJ9_SAGOE|nr:hypothetical protein P7K49_012949 [Saguinus oedipus]KAK2107808.1 hypothetical protein P7K49_012973 [Saguinus oedipus]
MSPHLGYDTEAQTQTWLLEQAPRLIPSRQSTTKPQPGPTTRAVHPSTIIWKLELPPTAVLAGCTEPIEKPGLFTPATEEGARLWCYLGRTPQLQGFSGDSSTQAALLEGEEGASEKAPRVVVGARSPPVRPRIGPLTKRGARTHTLTVNSNELLISIPQPGEFRFAPIRHSPTALAWPGGGSPTRPRLQGGAGGPCFSAVSGTPTKAHGKAGTFEDACSESSSPRFPRGLPAS